MKLLSDYLGIGLIIAGALTLLSTRFSTFGSNTVLLGGLLLIVVGTVVHIITIKRDSPY